MASVSEVSRWHHFFDGQQHSPQAFFTSLDAAIEKRKIPDTEMSRIELAEGPMLMGKREYVRIARQGYTFDVCAAPFGSGFFVSWWFLKRTRSAWIYLSVALVVAGVLAGLLVKVFDIWIGSLTGAILVPALYLCVGYAVRRGILLIEDDILAIPVVGWLYTAIFRPFTYYRRDTERTFEKAVHAAIMEVVDELTNAKGIRALSEFERKPIHREIARR